MFASVFVYPQIDDEIVIDIRPRICGSIPSVLRGRRTACERTDRDSHDYFHRHRQCQNERSQQEPRQRHGCRARSSMSRAAKRVEERKLEDIKLGINFAARSAYVLRLPHDHDHRTLAIGDVDRVLDGDSKR
jgi:peptide chain release factor 2